MARYAGSSEEEDSFSYVSAVIYPKNHIISLEESSKCNALFRNQVGTVKEYM